MVDWVGRWNGMTVACLASGPSLTPEDVEIVRGAGVPTVVTNTTFRVAPWADALFGFDLRWWKTYAAEVNETFAGLKLSNYRFADQMGVESVRDADWFFKVRNSGACAISLAISAAARRVVLLGYDCQLTDGKSHHHGDHPKPFSNCQSMPHWPAQFATVARHARHRGVEVINASRATALTCFPRMDLREALACA